MYDGRGAKFRYRIDSKSLQGRRRGMHADGAHTFATRRGAKVTEYRGHPVIIARRSRWQVQVQGFPEYFD